MKILFLTADLGGNVPPTLAAAEELARRNAVVEIAGLAPGRTTHSQPVFRPALAATAGPGGRGLGKVWRLLRLMAGRSTSTAAQQLVAEHPADVVVVDCMLPAVLKGVLRSGTPVVVLFHTVGEFWIRAFDGGTAGAFFGALGVRPRKLWEQASSRLLLTDRRFDPSSNDPELTEYTWTGTTETGVASTGRSAEGRPQVLVALTSTDWPGLLPVYRRIVAALAELPVDAVVTTGGVDLGGELAGADNVTIHGWIDHASLLPAIDLVIGHGGHSSTLKALAHGIPLLVLPINSTSDQPLIGEILESEGLGERLPQRSTPEQIGRAVQRMLDDRTLRERAAQMGERMRAEPAGAGVAADLIMDLPAAAG